MTPLYRRLWQQEPAQKIDIDEAEAFFEPEETVNLDNSIFIGGILPWTISLLCILVTISLGLANIFQNSQPTYFTTDFPDARQFVEYEQRKYTGALAFDPRSNRIVRVLDSEVEYFGPPSAEIDTAWKHLLRDRILVMTREEAAPFRPELTPIGSSGSYIFELDMYHSLHCINSLRIALSPVLYPNAEQPHNYLENVTVLSESEHLEHCLDRIRQVVMCYGDLTPSPFYSFKGYEVVVGVAGQHMCRKLEPIRAWMDQRQKRYPLNFEIDVEK